MEDKSSSNKCMEKCDASFRACIFKGEHESVCRMKRVPCDCSCTME